MEAHSDVIIYFSDESALPMNNVDEKRQRHHRCSLSIARFISKPCLVSAIKDGNAVKGFEGSFRITAGAV